MNQNVVGYYDVLIQLINSGKLTELICRIASNFICSSCQLINFWLFIFVVYFVFVSIVHIVQSPIIDCICNVCCLRFFFLIWILLLSLVVVMALIGKYWCYCIRRLIVMFAVVAVVVIAVWTILSVYSMQSIAVPSANRFYSRR